MEGAVVRPFEPDVSIAPPTRVPGVPSDGKLCIPDRSRRSRATFDSSRQAADDGFREYQSTVLADFPPMAPAAERSKRGFRLAGGALHSGLSLDLLAFVQVV